MIEVFTYNKINLILINKTKCIDRLFKLAMTVENYRKLQLIEQEGKEDVDGKFKEENAINDMLVNQSFITLAAMLRNPNCCEEFVGNPENVK